MEEKYFLVNGYYPCMCTCHKSCLRNDLIRKGFTIISMEKISKKKFDYYVKKIKEIYPSVKLKYTYF